MSLRGVLDERDPITVGNFLQWSEIGGLAVEVDRQNRFRPRREAVGDPVRVHGVSDRIDVDEHRPGTAVTDCPAGGDERHRDSQHLVARPDTGPEEREVQGGRSGIQRDAMLDTVSEGERLLERDDRRTQDVATTLRDGGECIENLIPNLGELRLEVHEWDRGRRRVADGRGARALIGTAPDR